MVSFVETKLFTQLVQKYLSDEDYSKLQLLLMEKPQAGNVIPGSGGVRKLRWRAPGRGKRGGYRVIYFTRVDEDVIWLLTIYPKNVKENIPAHILKEVRKEIENE